MQGMGCLLQQGRPRQAAHDSALVVAVFFHVREVVLQGWVRGLEVSVMAAARSCDCGPVAMNLLSALGVESRLLGVRPEYHDERVSTLRFPRWSICVRVNARYICRLCWESSRARLPDFQAGQTSRRKISSNTP